MLIKSLDRRCVTTLLGPFLLAFASPQASQAADRHVPSDYATIQAAVNAAADGDQVVVATGTYTGAGNVDVDFLGKAITVRSETGNPADCVIDCENSAGAFRFMSGETQSTVLQGFTITHASAPADSGAVVILGAGPTIQSCRFVSNGTNGIYAADPAFLLPYYSIEYCDFLENQGSGVHLGIGTAPAIYFSTFGGNLVAGVRTEYGSGAGIFECSFNNNTSGIRADGDQVYMAGCSFTGNDVGFDAVSVAMEDSRFNGNRIGLRCTWAGGFFQRCRFEQNEIGLINDGTSLFVHDSKFLRNQTGIYGQSVTGFRIQNTLLQGNTGWAVDLHDTSLVEPGNIGIYMSLVSGNGDGVRVSGVAEPQPGGALSVLSTTIVGNGDGGLLILDYPGEEGTTELSDLILWGNGVADLVGANAVYSDIGTGNTAGTGNISADPLFVRNPFTNGPDDYGDLHPKPGSPCIDAGSRNTGISSDYWGDLEGRPRIFGPMIDMGCYEYPGPAQAHAGQDQTWTVPHDGDPATSVVKFWLPGWQSTGTNLTYVWSEGGVVFATTAVVELDRGPGTYTFTLEVTDIFGATSTDDTQITILPEPNGAPTSNAGPDQTFNSTGTNVTLDGSASSDPDGDAITYSWSENGTEIATGVSPTVSFGPGTHTVTLTVTDPYGAASSDTVLITVNAYTLDLTSLSKTYAYVGGSPVTVTATGSGFKPGAVITWNGAPLPTTFLSSTQVRTLLGAEQLSTAGVYELAVKNTDGGASNPLPFTVLNRAPSITSLNPASVVHGSPGFTLTVNGLRFAPGAVVNWNGSPRPTTFVSATQLLVTIYDTDVATAGRAAVTAVNPAPGGGTSSVRYFPIR